LQATINTASAGTFSATYTLNLSDDTSITGHTGQSISLTLTGKARGASTLYWTGGTSSWDVGTTSNWTDLSTSEVYLSGDTVNFDDTHATNRSVTLNTAVTPAAVTISNSSGNNYTIGGSGSIGGTAGLTKTGSGGATLSTVNSYSGGTTVNGSGTLTATKLTALGTGPLAINNTATAKFQGNLGTVVLPSVKLNNNSVAPTATLDIDQNSVVIPYVSASPFATIRKQVMYGANNGTGIISSSADGSTTGVGYAEAGELGIDGGGTYDNNQPTSTSTTITDEAVIMKYTFIGDFNLDGNVDFADFTNWAGNSGDFSGTADWFQGDANYDGNVDFSDFSAWAGNEGSTGLAANGPVPVPEPSTLVLGALGFLGLAALRRRRRAR
jgi:hypothetical protein